tara:strand:- start:101 stop:1135 length:1035 start_codon:yes stop_codon:yes gene_type:complete
MDYKTAGVDVEAGRNFVNQIKSSVESTHFQEVIGGLGGFGGFMRIPKGFREPILVAGTDGVGTKLELAQAYKNHLGVGIDLVAMCVNDVITSGAKPLFFLDYIATGSLQPDALAKVIEGISEGCRQSGCALLGGETAEMPGFYQKDKYDLAGFCVGVVEESDLIDGRFCEDGDRIIGIESSGFHSNGFSLVRDVLKKVDLKNNDFSKEQKVNLIELLLRPTSIYVALVKGFLEADFPIHGMAHITGGGLPENLPRCLPKGLQPLIDPTSWQIPPLFSWLQEVGDIPEIDLWNTFNLGVGFCLVVPEDHEKRAIALSSQIGFQAWPIGQVKKSLNEETGLIGLPF